MDQFENSLYCYIWGSPLIRFSEILTDFSRELGYEVHHFEIPHSFRSTDDYSTFDLVSFGKIRDGVLPTNHFEINEPAWCVIQTLYDDQGRVYCVAEIELLMYNRDDYSKIILDPLDSNMFTKLTVFLDYWYFVIFQRD